MKLAAASAALVLLLAAPSLAFQAGTGTGTGTGGIVGGGPRVAPTSAFVARGRGTSSSFSVGTSRGRASRLPPASSTTAAAAAVAVVVLRAKSTDDDGESDGGKKANPYADPNYPDLEFIDYSDPEYVVDQGVVGDEFFPSSAEAAAVAAAAEDGGGEKEEEEEEGSTEDKIEAMREERRKRNDEYQFETYHAEVLRGGREEYRGEWTVYRTSSFPLPGREGAEDAGEAANGDGGGGQPPRLVKSRDDLRVVSSGKKVLVDTDSEWRVDGERLVHEERLHNDAPAAKGSEYEAATEEILSNHYWPEFMSADDFRGPQGIMCVGNAYTICDTVPLDGKEDEEDDGSDSSHEGPFGEYRAEVGIQYKRMRMRVKFDYRSKVDGRGDDGSDRNARSHPPLYLRSMTVCRETRDRWPRHDPGRTDVEDQSSAGLFGPATGAPGGLYDPPPVGSDEQAARYLTLDLEGSATVLFPYKMDQRPGAFGDNGWVMSLDWTPGRIRYQVDRKILGTKKMKGLKTLELSEVQGSEAEQWRPKDGGANMRQ